MGCEGSLMDYEIEYQTVGQKVNFFVQKYEKGEQPLKYTWTFEIAKHEDPFGTKNPSEVVFQSYIYPTKDFGVNLCDLVIDGVQCKLTIGTKKKNAKKSEVKPLCRRTGLNLKGAHNFCFVFAKFHVDQNFKKMCVKKEIFQLKKINGNSFECSRVLERGDYYQFLGQALSRKQETQLVAQTFKYNPVRKLSSLEINTLKRSCRENVNIQKIINEWTQANYASYYNLVGKNKTPLDANCMFLFFDGTACNANKPHSNVMKLRNIVKAELKHLGFKDKAIEKKTVYVQGVGSEFTFDVIGKLIDIQSGREISERLHQGYLEFCDKFFKSKIKREKLRLFVFGYSRGSFTALSFVNLINACGIHKKRVEQEKAFKEYTSSQTYQGTPVPVEYLGLIDCVSTIRDNEYFHKTDLTNIKKTFHCLALNERRFEYFPTLPKEVRGNQCISRWVLGTHTDTGGVKGKTQGDLALLEIMKECPFMFPSFAEKHLSKITKKFATSEIKMGNGNFLERLVFMTRGHIIRRTFLQNHHQIHPSVFFIIKNNLLQDREYQFLSNLAHCSQYVNLVNSVIAQQYQINPQPKINGYTTNNFYPQNQANRLMNQVNRQRSLSYQANTRPVINVNYQKPVVQGNRQRSGSYHMQQQPNQTNYQYQQQQFASNPRMNMLMQQSRDRSMSCPQQKVTYQTNNLSNPQFFI